MTDQITLGDKKASIPLSMMLRECAGHITDFTVSWREIVDNGKVEGFSEPELISMLRPLVKKALEGYGVSTKMVNNKVYYLVHRDEIIENKHKRDEEKVARLNVQPVEEDSSWNKDSLLDELGRVRTELQEANEQIKNISFSDNPEVFCIRRDSDNYFARVSIREIAGLLSGMYSDNGTKVNFGFEEAKE